MRVSLLLAAKSAVSVAALAGVSLGFAKRPRSRIRKNRSGSSEMRTMGKN